jgi:hypothetical protein
LKEKGLVFSDPVTEGEIDAAKKAYEAKKDLEGLDSRNIIDDKRRRGEKELETLGAVKRSKSNENAAANSQTESHNSENGTGRVVLSKEERKKYLENDEEF